MKFKREIKALIISLAVSVVFVLIGVLSGDLGVMGNSIILSTLVIIGPQIFFKHQEHKYLKEMETRFPTFLRDVVETIRSGMPFHQAVILNSNIDYGKLSIHVKKMAHQLSWAVPFDKTVNYFSQRVIQSKKLSSGLRTIRESFRSGGDVISTLESVADSMIMVEESEKEKKSLLSQYIILMYAISFMFVGIVVAINKLMIPIFQVATESQTGISLGGMGGMGFGLSNPCTQTAGFGYMVCQGFDVISNALGLGNVFDEKNIGAYYVSLFFLMSVIVSFCSGIVAGQISENSIVAGIKHSIIMISAVVGSFYILVYLKLLGV
ncbi:MAG: type II secretion system F family protein [Candidatus Aenigmatarchaeota archaeon]